MLRALAEHIPRQRGKKMEEEAERDAEPGGKQGKLGMREIEKLRGCEAWYMTILP